MPVEAHGETWGGRRMERKTRKEGHLGGAECRQLVLSLCDFNNLPMVFPHRLIHHDLGMSAWMVRGLLWTSSVCPPIQGFENGLGEGLPCYVCRCNDLAKSKHEKGFSLSSIRKRVIPSLAIGRSKGRSNTHTESHQLHYCIPLAMVFLQWRGVTTINNPPNAIYCAVNCASMEEVIIALKAMTEL